MFRIALVLSFLVAGLVVGRYTAAPAGEVEASVHPTERPTRQAQRSPQEVEALEAVHALFDAMKAKDTEAIAALFHPEARLLSTSVQGGATAVQAVAIPDFVASIGSSAADLEERIWDEEVRVDGPLATAWTPYAFFVDGTFSHCGVNSFQLARMEDGWRILHVVDTRRADACPEGAPR